jgi:hypothetical protein
MTESVPAKAWPRKTEAISGRIIPWAVDELGVAYDFADGKHTAHAIEQDAVRLKSGEVTVVAWKPERPPA